MRAGLILLSLLLLGFLSAFANSHTHCHIGHSVCEARGTLVEGYKEGVARRVFDDLVEAKGVKNMPIPKFRLVNSQRNVAWSNSELAEIGLEEKAYDICTLFGADSLNALAGILAHELTHYYEKHGWTEMFAADFSEMESSAEIARLDQHLPQETQADYLGGFLSYAAGYQTLGMMPQFLDKVYQAYGFEEAMPGYPTLADRQEMATASLKRCQELIHVFETANYLVALEQYGPAKGYYQYILKDFQSREMYNNLGVATTLEAMALFSKKDLHFAYPLELDAESRLKNGHRGGQQGFGEDQTQREALLKMAISHFKTAIVLDEDYAVGYLNLANVYALLHEPMDAEYNARKAIKIAKKEGRKKTVADAQVLLGILAAQEDETASAIGFFDQAVANGSSLGMINKNILLEKTMPATPAASALGMAKPDRIGEVSLDKLVVDLQRENLVPELLIEIDQRTTFARVDDEQSEVLIHLLPYDEVYTFLQITNPAYVGATGKGMKPGSSRQEVLDAYGEADRQLQLAQGEYLVYYKRKLLFILDEKGQVSRWGVFRFSEH